MFRSLHLTSLSDLSAGGLGLVRTLVVILLRGGSGGRRARGSRPELRNQRRHASLINPGPRLHPSEGQRHVWKTKRFR